MEEEKSQNLLKVMHGLPQVAVPDEYKDLGLRVVDGVPMTDSRVVAEKFDKRHDNVLRTIDELIKDVPECLLNFEETVIERENPSGGAPLRSRAYLMNRDGFANLVGDFSGSKARRWRFDFIQAFNAIERALAEIVLSKQDVASDPRFIMGALAEASTMIKELARGQTTQHQILVDVRRDQLNLRQDFTGLAEQFQQLRRDMPVRRKDPSKATLRKLTALVGKTGGLCPCCRRSERVIVSNGQLLRDERGQPLGQFDHFFSKDRNKFEDMWLICVPCHDMLNHYRRQNDACDQVTRSRTDRAFHAFHDTYAMFFIEPPAETTFYGHLGEIWPIAKGDRRWIGNKRAR